MIDAFTGDGVPSHLLTREAMTVYFKRLAARNGLLVVHASTRYSSLFPVVDATARSLGRSAIDVVTEITASTDTRDWDATRTEYIVVGPFEIMRTLAAWFPLEEDPNRIRRSLTVTNSAAIPQNLVWSDERNAAIDAFELNQYLFKP